MGVYVDKHQKRSATGYMPGESAVRSVTPVEALEGSRDMKMHFRFRLWLCVRHSLHWFVSNYPYNTRPLSGSQIG